MRVLVVEDNHKIANSIKQGLEQESYAVDVAYNGNDGYDLAATEPYDLIILDLMLPGLSGEKICSNLRQESKHTPIIMLTAKSELENKVEGLNIGADDYLTKPFAFAELLARIKALLRRPNHLLSNELTCNDLKVDTQTFEVTIGNKHIDLSKKEFALLEYLMRNKNLTLTKDKIIGHVWDYDSNVLPNTVEVYIGYLRNKIGKEFIKTVRGFGYKISCEGK